MHDTITAPYTPELDITDWREIATTLSWGGYVHTDNPIDRPIAEAGRCPHCGQGLTYAGRQRPGTYRAFAVCEPCNQGVEF
jgi:uncharacterized protein (DUF983 family)